MGRLERDEKMKLEKLEFYSVLWGDLNRKESNKEGINV